MRFDDDCSLPSVNVYTGTNEAELRAEFALHRSQWLQSLREHLAAEGVDAASIARAVPLAASLLDRVFEHKDLPMLLAQADYYEPAPVH